MLYLLLIITILFILVNFKFSNKHVLQPSVLFCIVFLISILECVINSKKYQISFSIVTLLILLVGFGTFTLSHFFLREKNIIKSPCELQLIKIPTVIAILFFIIQLSAIFSFWLYLKNLAIANGSSLKLNEMISTYNMLSKFNQDTLRSLNVSIPFIFRVANPLSEVIGYYCLYVLINNWICERKYLAFPVVSIFLLVILSMMSGSRTPLFRMATFVAIVGCFLKIRKDGKLFLNIKTIGIAAIFLVCLWLIAFTSMKAIGRDISQLPLSDYIFVYTGAPLLNLDSFVRSVSVKWIGKTGTGIFGGQTFAYLYGYISKIFHVPYPSIENLHVFTTSPNGLDTGNVYTMFLPLIHDFGIIGMIPAILLMAFYYNYSYKKIVENHISSSFDYRLFIYAYLINDLVMSPFANRFYNTVFSAGFIKFFTISGLGYLLFSVWRKKVQKGRSVVKEKV